MSLDALRQRRRRRRAAAAAEPAEYAVTKKMKQKDRIADDYYELLRNVA